MNLEPQRYHSSTKEDMKNKYEIAGIIDWDLAGFIPHQVLAVTTSKTRNALLQIVIKMNIVCSEPRLGICCLRLQTLAKVHFEGSWEWQGNHLCYKGRVILVGLLRTGIILTPC